MELLDRAERSARDAAPLSSSDWTRNGASGVSCYGSSMLGTAESSGFTYRRAGIETKSFQINTAPGRERAKKA